MRKLAIVALIICAAVALISLTACRQNEPQTREWNLSGMNCVACEREVRSILEELGVTVTNLSAQNDNVQFEFNPRDVSEEEIIQALADGGYHIVN